VGVQPTGGDQRLHHHTQNGLSADFKQPGGGVGSGAPPTIPRPPARSAPGLPDVDHTQTHLTLCMCMTMH